MNYHTVLKRNTLSRFCWAFVFLIGISACSNGGSDSNQPEEGQQSSAVSVSSTEQEKEESEASSSESSVAVSSDSSSDSSGESSIESSVSTSVSSASSSSTSSVIVASESSLSSASSDGGSSSLSSSSSSSSSISSLNSSSSSSLSSFSSSSVSSEVSSSSSSAPAITDLAGWQVYSSSCATCHDSGAAGAPMLGDRAEWQRLLAEKGLPALYENTILGLAAMPPRGLCVDCSDVVLVEAVNYMLAASLGDGEDKIYSVTANGELLKPIAFLTPQYPRRAAQRGIEGYVVLQYDLGVDASPTNTVVLSSSNSVFERSAIQAHQKALFESGGKGDLTGVVSVYVYRLSFNGESSIATSSSSASAESSESSVSEQSSPSISPREESLSSNASADSSSSVEESSSQASSASSVVSESDTIKVGVLHSLSGTMAIAETELKDTILALIEEQNKAGGLLGRKLEAIVVDPASNWPLFAEKTRDLLSKEKVDVIFGGYTSVSRKSVLPILEDLNGLMFYPASFEGEESSKNIIYSGSAPNQSVIPVIDYLLDQGIEQWVLEGTDYVYPRTLNKIAEAYLLSKGVSQDRIDINYTPFGHSQWQTRVEQLASMNSSFSTAVISTVYGDANVPLFNALAAAGLSADNLSVVSMSVGESELSGFSVQPFVDHLVAWSYFMSLDTPQNEAFITLWQQYVNSGSRVVNDAMAAHYVGFKAWSKAVEFAATTEVDAVRNALYQVSVVGLDGVENIVQPNHYFARTPRIGKIDDQGMIYSVWQGDGPIGGDAWTDYLPGSVDAISNWQDPDIFCGNYNTVIGVCSGQN